MATLTPQIEKRNTQRDRRIRGIERPFLAQSRNLARQLKGLLVESTGSDTLSLAIDRVLQPYPDTAASTMDGQLSEFWEWAYASARRQLLDLKGTKWWAAWMLRNRVTEAILERSDEYNIDIENQLLGVIRGDITGQAARDVVDAALFDPPSAEEVDFYLSRTQAPDGLSAMQRIKTVAETDLAELKETLIGKWSGGETVGKLAQDVERVTGLIHWKSMRIARTEGVRIAQDALEKSYEGADDLIDGFLWHSAKLADSAEFDTSLDGTRFMKEADGEYRAKGGIHDGLIMPTIPVHPNCLCYTTPILSPTIDFEEPPQPPLSPDRPDEPEPEAPVEEPKPEPEPSALRDILPDETYEHLPRSGTLGQITKWAESRYEAIAAERAATDSIYVTTPSDQLIEVQSRFASKLRQNKAWVAANPEAGPVKTRIEGDIEKDRERIQQINAEVARRREMYGLLRTLISAGESQRLGKIAIPDGEIGLLISQERDVYYEAGWRPEQGKPPYRPEIFKKSDLTGRGCRFFITLPDGRICHRDELIQARKRGRVVVIGEFATPTLDWSKKERVTIKKKQVEDEREAELKPEAAHNRKRK